MVSVQFEPIARDQGACLVDSILGTLHPPVSPFNLRAHRVKVLPRPGMCVERGGAVPHALRAGSDAVATAWRSNRVTRAMALDPPALSRCMLQCLRHSLLAPPGIAHHAMTDDG